MGHMRHTAIAVALTILAIETPPPTQAQTCGAWKELETEPQSPSIAISGDLALVSDWRDSTVVRSGGAVYSYKRTGTTWVEDGKFTADDLQRWEYLGAAVALEGDLSVIGAPSTAEQPLRSGAAYMFRRDGSAWLQEQKLTSPNPTGKDVFGIDVAIGDTIIFEGPPVIIGAPLDDLAGEDAGAAYIFQKTNGSWYLAATLTADDFFPFQQFGWSVSISGDRAVVGTGWAETVYVFERVGGAWVQKSKLRPIEFLSLDRFGWSVAIDGDHIAVGAHRFDGVATDSGAVYVYRREGSIWIPTLLTPPDAGLGDRFGEQVRMDGSSLLISAPYNTDVAAGAFAGSVYLYERTGTTWNAKERFIPRGAEPSDNFGKQIAIDANNIMAAGHYQGHQPLQTIYYFEPHDAPWPDCNENLEHDDCELDRGAAADCLGFGEIDACSIADGTSEDCNGNGVPDSCELADAPRLYWTEHDCCNFNSGNIRRGYIDGTNVENLVWFEEPRNLALDRPTGTMYWSDSEDFNNFTGIWRAPLDGTVRQRIVGMGRDQNSSGLALDAEAGKIYWIDTDNSGRGLRRANLDGSGQATVIEEARAPIAVDQVSGKIYWTSATDGDIQRANMDGTGIEEVVVFTSGAPHDIALDVQLGKIYWINRSDDKVQRANLDGSEVEDLVTDIWGPKSIALDLTAGKVYWTRVNRIERADLDGLNVQDVLTIYYGAGGLAIARANQDCNGNGQLDTCDVSSGISLDTDGNGLPDECDPDCNLNGIPDRLDIVDGTSEDCTGDGRPDECDPDCDATGSSDRCDIADGTSMDCNLNTIPDSCDLADLNSVDANGNGIPDECEPDCNGNQITDDLDIASGTSEDCNATNIPDECEIADGSSKDCNENDIPDVCDLEAGAEDCGELGNGIPDICEPDCNSNGVADTCDVRVETSQDCNTNDIPDECEDGHASTGECRRLHILPVDEIPGTSIITGNSIEAVPGSVVELHMLISNWGEAGDGNLSRIYFKMNGSSFTNGVGDDLMPVGFATPDGCPTTSGDSCDEGGFIKVKQGVATGCDCTFGHCEEPPACMPNPDYVFHDFSPSVSVTQDTTDYEYRSIAFGLKADEGIEEYCGTLRLEIPPGAAGTYTIDLVDDPAVNFIWDGTGAVFPYGAIAPATINIAVNGACCAGPSCSALLNPECAAIGGTFLGNGTTCDQPDADGDGLPDACESIPGFAAPPHHIAKNRFLSIDPWHDPAEPIALKVELLDRSCSVNGQECTTSFDCKACVGGERQGGACFIDSDCPGSACALSGETCGEQSPPVLLGWVADPVLIAADQEGRVPPETYHSLLVSSQPEPRVWTEEVIHIGDCEIAPAQAYAISATADGNVFKSPLVIDTVRKPQGKFWGDVVGNFDGTGWTAANGLVSVDDVTAVIKFITLKPAPHITVVDLGGEVPNWLINASDLQFVLGAFKGNSYPPVAFPNQGGPADCP